MRGTGGIQLARSTGVASGLLVLLLGAWGALVPFVGPYFGYAFASHATWVYDSNRLWLDVLPGGAAVIAGLLLVTASARRALIVGASIGFAAGAWFLAGPAVSGLWGHGAAAPIGRPLGGQTRQAIELLGSFYALGGMILALVSFASGRLSTRRPAAAEVPTRSVTAGVFDQPGYAEEGPPSAAVTRERDAAAAPARRRRSVLRRRRGATTVRG